MSVLEGHVPQIHIRYAAPSDNILLAEVGAETFRDTFAAENTRENMATYLAKSFSLEQQRLELADPASKFLLAEVDGLTVGYAHLKLGQAPDVIAGKRPVEIARLYARKPWIGQGIGARLMQECLREAEHAGCDVIWLDVWERNLRAIAFYRKWGFAEVGSQVFQLGDDPQHDLLMARMVVK
jgi:diamine N-acetyltransferase